MVALKEGRGLGWEGHWLTQGAPAPRASPGSPTHSRAQGSFSPPTEVALPPRGWESGLGRTLVTHSPGVGARLFGPLAFLAFQGSEGGREASSQARGWESPPALQQKSIPPSFSLRSLCLPLPVSSRALRKLMRQPHPVGGTLCKALVVGRGLPYSASKEDLGGMDSGWASAARALVSSVHCGSAA